MGPSSQESNFLEVILKFAQRGFRWNKKVAKRRPVGLFTEFSANEHISSRKLALIKLKTGLGGQLRKSAAGQIAWIGTNFKTGQVYTDKFFF